MNAALAPELRDEIMQRTEWKARIIVALANREFERDTLIALVDAGFEQAYSEGLRDAAAVCYGVAEAQQGYHMLDRKLVASVLGNKIIELDERNRRDSKTPHKAGE